MLTDSFLPGGLPGTVANTVGLSVTNTSQTWDLSAIPGEYLEFNNAGANDVFVNLGDANVAAATIPAVAAPPVTAGSYIVRAGQCKVIRRKVGDTRIAAIAAVAGPTSLYVSAGVGN